MRTSHKKIRALINDEKSKITDEQLFCSKKFCGYLEDIAEVVSKRYKRPVIVRVIHNNKIPLVAETDNMIITINSANEYTDVLSDRVSKVNSLIGFLGHELGHVNFTDFCLLNIFYSWLKKGKFYPSEPIPESSEEEVAKEEIREMLKAKDDVALELIKTVLFKLANILEDSYIETKMCEEFPGKLKKGIIMQRVLMIDNAPSITEMLDKKYERLAIIMNLILEYATCSNVKNDGGYSGEFLDKLKNCIIHIDDAVYTDDIKARFIAASQILLKIWEYVKEKIEKEKEKQKDNSEDNSQNKKGNTSKSGDISNQMTQTASAPRGSTSSVAKKQGVQQTSGDEECKLKKAKEEIQKVVEEELGRMKLEQTDTITNENADGKLELDNSYGGSNYDNSASDIERVLTKVAEERVNKSLENELNNKLQTEANSISYGTIHKDTNITIRRINPVPEYMKSYYAQVAPELLLLSKKLQKGIQNVIKDRKFGGKLNGLYMGRRIDARNTVRDDGKYFYNRKLPDEELDFAVAVLVDESGSMSSRDRITVARATSIALYDFCRKINVPISIMGHSTAIEGVELFSYADFDSIDGNDKYRIMDMCARAGNRDGMPLRYVAEKLLKRNEKTKLLILISDGQPSDYGYSGTAAEEDLRQIKSEYTRKGITMFAAAIGDDKENIERIYKDGFLDITNLQKMPVNLIKLISRYVK